MAEDFPFQNVVPIRVLHVDDEAAHLEITRIFLNRESKGDFDIVSVLSAEDALEKLENEYFDVVVSDCKMPGMNGLDFLDAVRHTERYAGIPFILFTSADKSKVMNDALKFGVVRYIAKKGNPSIQCNLLARVIYELTLKVASVRTVHRYKYLSTSL
ncbi:MAG: response regulator [Halobacteriota archaeon]